MANIKITELTAYGDPVSADVLPIVDVGSNVTKKVSIADLLKNASPGTEALPGIAFDGDLNTGIYRPDADQLAISTSGAQALYIDSDGDILVADGNRMEIDEIRARDGDGLKLFDDGGAGIFIADGGNVGLGTSNPTHLLDVNAGFATFKLTGVGTDVTNQLSIGTGAGLYWVHNDRATAGLQINTTGYFSGEYPITLKTQSGTTALFIDTSSRVGIGNTNPSEALDVSGNVTISGSISKGSGSFKITHPLETKKDTHYLVHSFIEGPQADLIYRGHVQLFNGIASVNIDKTARMTEGTFEALCTNVCCFTSNETDWTAVRGSVSGNILTIEAQDQTSTADVCWMVVGERKDQHMLHTDWTDENGRVITELPKSEVDSSEED